MRLEFQDCIDRYLLNRMSDEERISFEKKCANNPEIKEQLEHTQDVMTVISERSKLLEKIQCWADEYDEEKKSAARKKRLAIYWISGFAAVFVMGYFLFPTANKMELEGSGNLVAMNQNRSDTLSTVQTMDSLSKLNYKSEKLLAQNDAVKEKPNRGANTVDEKQVFSFGYGEFKTKSPQGMKEYEEELRKIVQEKEIVTDEITYLNYQLNTGEIDKYVYASMIHMLNYQRDNLSWREVQVLLKLNRKEEALAILIIMKSAEGEFQNSADSLYNINK